MAFEIVVPTPSGPFSIKIEPGSSAIVVGANGGGKTRLAVLVEEGLKASAHRISAHRALSLNPSVPKISEADAFRGLTFGTHETGTTIQNRQWSRWRQNAAGHILNDFDYLIQLLFAEQANKSLETHKKVRSGHATPAEPTKFELLISIWDRLLPHRELHISGDDILVSVSGSSAKYTASDMSDGERSIFYMIGQTLAASDNSLLIFDEPELHVHRSIMSKLWDELEAVRPDCGFLFITHDLEFAASRVAQKFVIRDYDPAPRWTIESVPENTGFDEEITTLILGSRRPILFAEGEDTSLDMAIYRCCFPDWTVIPRGSCENVIHSVVTMRANASLTRVTCSGIVDADAYEADDVNYLNRLDIAVLPVSEIENVILLPAVSQAIAESEGYAGAELATRLEKLKQDIFNSLEKTPGRKEEVVAQYCRRRIDRTLKKIDFSEAKSVAEIATEYRNRTAALDINAIAQQIISRIDKAIRDGDLPTLLANYDNKGLMALAASSLKGTRLENFESWLMRVLRNNSVPAIVSAIQNVLPVIRAR